MHDPALWASWYVWLLALPARVIGTLIWDWIQQRQPVRGRRRRSRRTSTVAGQNSIQPRHRPASALSRS